MWPTRTGHRGRKLPRPFGFLRRQDAKARFVSHMKIALFCSSIFLLGSALAEAAVNLPAIFSDHLVLQREAKVPVWGWADPGAEVSVSIAGKSQSTKAGADGK